MNLKKFITKKSITILVLATLIIVIALQNTELVETKILFMTITMSRAALIGFVGFLGFGLGFLAFYYRQEKKHKHD